jgi:outer membrane lipoprotein-sorting protein
LLIALMGVLALAACSAALPTADEIVAKMQAARAATTSAHATVALDFTSPDRSGQFVVEGWSEQTGATDAAGHPIARMRAEVRTSSEKSLEGMIAVSDGTTFWLYNQAENTVVTGATSQMKDAVAATPAGAATMLTDMVAKGLDAVNLEVLGSEQVAGKTTWKVKVTPKPETSAKLNLASMIEGTLWVDTELALPLKLSLDASDLGSGSLVVQSIETNQPIDAARFTFTPPTGAKIVQAADLAAKIKQPKAASLDEARTAVSFTLREPSYLPAGLALVEVRVVGTSTVILNYGGAGSNVSVVQSNEDVGRDRVPPDGSQTSDVTVNGLPATLITGSDGTNSLLRWQDGGVRYVIAGPLAGTEALKVAEGLK